MRPRPEQPVSILIVRDLETGPATAYDLAAAVGIHVRNVRVYLRFMRESGVVHICGWEANKTGPAVPVWGHGPGKNKPRPKPKYKRRGLK